MHHRERINYSEPRWPDPTIPRHFIALEKHGMKKLLPAYSRDITEYAFDSDHAIMAFPIYCMKHLLGAKCAFSISDSEKAFLEQNLNSMGANLSSLVLPL